MRPGPDTRLRAPLRWALLALILALGGYLRFTDIRQMVPYMVDDGMYHLEGQFYLNLFEAFRDTILLRVEEAKTGEDLWKREAELPKLRARVMENPILASNKAPLYARPLQSGLVAIALGVLGKDALYAGPAVSAVTGTLLILVVYLLARRIYGDRAALLAALFAAIAGYLVLYARNGFSEMNSALFLALSLYAYYRSREAWPERPYGWIFASGVSWGLACTAQDRWLLMFLIPLLYEAQLWLSERFRGVGRLFLRLVALGLGLLAPLAAFELPFYLGMLGARVFGGVLPFPTYFEQLFQHIKLLVGSDIAGILIGFGPANLLSYPYLFLVLNGPVLTALFLGGALWVFRRRRFDDFFLGFWFWFPFLYYGLTAPRARYASIFLPPAAILAAGLFARWTAGRRLTVPGRSIPATAALLGVAALGLTGLLQTANVIEKGRTCYEAAFDFIRASGEVRHVTTSPVTSAVQVGLANAELAPASRERLEALYRGGYRWYLMDFFQFYRPSFLEPERRPAGPENPFSGFYAIEDLAAEVAAAGPPAFACENPCVDLAGNMFEWNYRFAWTWDFMHRPREMERRVRVYDLAKVFPGVAPEAAPSAEAGEAASPWTPPAETPAP